MNGFDTIPDRNATAQINERVQIAERARLAPRERTTRRRVARGLHHLADRLDH